MYIKCTSKMSKGMELNGNVLSGDTYGVREYIKTYWAGKWDAARKVWIVDSELVVKTIQEQGWGFTKVLQIYDSAPESVVTTTPSRNGWCNKCQSWCYGDCTANS